MGLKITIVAACLLFILSIFYILRRYEILRWKQWTTYFIIALFVGFMGSFSFQVWLQNRYWGNSKDMKGTVGYINDFKYSIMKTMIENDVREIISSRDMEKISNIFDYPNFQYLHIEIWDSQELIYQNINLRKEKLEKWKEDITLNDIVIKTAFKKRQTAWEIVGGRIYRPFKKKMGLKLATKYYFSRNFDFILVPSILIITASFLIIFLATFPIFKWEEERITKAILEDREQDND